MCTGKVFIHKKFEFPLILILNAELFLFIMIRYAEASMQRLPALTKNPSGCMVGVGSYGPGDGRAFYAILVLGWRCETTAPTGSRPWGGGAKGVCLKSIRGLYRVTVNGTARDYEMRTNAERTVNSALNDRTGSHNWLAIRSYTAV